MENNKTPSIRFKGFTDPWEQRKVSEVSEIVAGGTPSTSVSEYWEPKEVPWLSSGEVHKKYITYTDDMISKNGLANSSTKIIKKNSVLIALAGQGKTRGTVAINRISLSTNQSIAAMSFNDDIVPEFVFSNLENRYDEIRAMSSGDGSRGGLNKQLVGDITIPYTIKEEQQKIGQYFSNLDHLITLHQRKYNKLLNVKKSMLEKMFPKNGSNIPEIRFKGFTDPWEQRKVFEIADRFDNLRVPVAANLRIPGNTPYYGANGIQDYVEGYTHDGEYILVAEDGASDLKNYPVNYVNGRIWVNNHAHVLQGKEKIANNKFLSYAMRLADIESVLVGGGRAKLNADIMMNLDIAIPSFNEQEQIGAYFSNLDNLITLHQRELEKLQNIKKSMLEKMFV